MPDDEAPSLESFLVDAIQQQLGGIVTGHVSFVEYINSEGRVDRAIFSPDIQPTWRSLGMANCLSEWFRDDMVSEMYSFAEPEEDE